MTLRTRDDCFGLVVSPSRQILSVVTEVQQTVVTVVALSHSTKSKEREINRERRREKEVRTHETS